MLHDKISNVVEGSAKFLLGFALVVGASVLTSFALMTLWNWFVAPLGIHSITLLWAYGLNLIVSSFTLHSRPSGESLSLEWAWNALKKSTSAAAAVLILGWLAHHWM